VTGVSDAYLAQLEAAVVEVARRALASRRPATLTAAETRVEGVCKDVRPPDLRNETAAALLARGLDGKPIAVLVNFAMHPEGLWKTNRMISSDYPHYLRERIERDFPGATALFVSADLGGMQTPDVKEHTHEEVRRCGETIALRARDALAGAATSDVRELKFESRALDLPLENRRFLAAFQFGAFGKDLGATLRSSGDGVALRSEISALRLGDILFVTVPGEALPEVGREIFALMDARHKFLVGLGQDEVGYLLPKEDFDPKKYEESMSLGPQTAPTLLDALKKLLKGF
jgi:hypothetical protein